MTNTLSQEEYVAQSLLLLHGQSSVMALSTQSAIQAALRNMVENNPDPTADDYRKVTNTVLRNAGHLTDIDSMASQAEYLKSSHAGWWSGEYTVLDDRGGIHKLYINNDTISLLLDGHEELVTAPSEGGVSYSNGAINVDNDKATLSLQIQSPVDALDFDDATIDVAQYLDRCEPTVVGSLLIKGPPSQTLALKGKRGVQTPGGVLSDVDGEPAWCWGGEYRLCYTGSDSWEWSADNLVLDIDANTGRFAMRIGNLVASALGYGKHSFFGSISFKKGIATQFLLAMSCGRDGSRKFYAWFETTGQMRTATGYGTSKLSENALWGRPASIDNLEAAPAPKKAMFRAALGAATAPTFCAAKHDKLFSVTQFVGTDAAAPTLASLFGGQGFAVSKASITGASPSLDRLLYTVAAGDAGKAAALKLPGGARLTHFQLPGSNNHAQSGEANCQLGVLLPAVCKVNGLLEGSTNDSYFATRLSLTDFSTLSADGFDLALAVDDAAHHAFQLHPPGSATCTGDGSGVSAAVAAAVPDFSKASVLLFGEVTQGVDSVSYYLKATPKSAAAQIAVDMTPAYSDSTPVKVSSKTLPYLIKVEVSFAATSSKAADFFTSPYDTVVFASSMIAAADDPGAQTPDSLFTAAGHRVDYHDGSGKLESYAVFTTAGSETGNFPSNATLRPYQKVDEVTNVPLEGADNCLVGVLIGQKYPMPVMVETDSYDVRFSVSGYEKINPDGLTIELAEDDANQKTLLGLAQPLATDATSPYPATDPWGRGPDPDMKTKIADYTKASVLVKGTTGETQIVGMKNYLFAVTPKTDNAYSIQASRQIYDATDAKVGDAVQVNVPILLHVAIQMDSRDQIVLSGEDWPTMARGKDYVHTMGASYGQAPLAWRVTQDGGFGPDAKTNVDLDWTGSTKPGADYSAGPAFGLKGTVKESGTVGTVYTPTIRVMSDRSVVMKPTMVSASITLDEPETQSRSDTDRATFVAEVLGGIALLCTFGYFIYRKIQDWRGADTAQTELDKKLGRIESVMTDNIKKYNKTATELGAQCFTDFKAHAQSIATAAHDRQLRAIQLRNGLALEVNAIQGQVALERGQLAPNTPDTQRITDLLAEITAIQNRDLVLAGEHADAVRREQEATNADHAIT